MRDLPLRRLNNQGIDKFREFLAEGRSRGWSHFEEEVTSSGLVQDPEFTEPVMEGSVLYAPDAWDRLTVARSLNADLAELQNLSDLARDRGLWAWVSLAWISRLSSSKGSTKIVGADYRYIPEFGLKYYKHFLLMPYMVYQLHQTSVDNAMCLLYQDISVPGQLNEDIGSYFDIVSRSNVLGAATRLYWDPRTRVAKPNAADKTGRGVARRFGGVVKQFALTWDLEQRSPDEILAMLPEEFDRFR